MLCVTQQRTRPYPPAHVAHCSRDALMYRTLTVALHLSYSGLACLTCPLRCCVERGLLRA